MQKICARDESRALHPLGEHLTSAKEDLSPLNRLAGGGDELAVDAHGSLTLDYMHRAQESLELARMPMAPEKIQVR
ncbi:MAG TPA: hypothetical protein VL176_04770, partial [Steroidobacteraceae bacterium]|nr:hypothetical protein [Steroidobacteraceae bacterium]